MKSDVVLGLPPVAIAGASFLGYSLPEWAAIVTIAYTILLIVKLAIAAVRDLKTRRRNRET